MPECIPGRDDARWIGERVATELHLAFVEHGFWVEARGSEPVHGRAYVAIEPVRADIAARLVERL
jgi:hypothetical protein